MEKKLTLQTSIRTKFILSFTLITFLTIIVFEIFSLVSIRYYYYSSLNGILRNQMKYATNLYTTYMSDYKLEDIILEDKNQFYRQMDGQVQILDNSGLVLYDSLGSPELGQTLTYPDVSAAKNDKITNSTVYTKKNGENKGIISISAPLKSRGNQVGIIRFVTSTEIIDGFIYRKTISFIFFGVFVMTVGVLFASVIARQLVKPIEELTRVATKFANGNYKERARINDYDELGKLGKTLNLLTDNINRKEKIKNEFISSVSHELRTPLTSISGWAQTCSYDPSDQELVKEGLEIINKESLRLSEMVEELLDFSRLTSGHIDVHPQRMNLVQIAKEVVRQLSPRAQSEKLDLLLNYEQPEIMAIVDAKRIKQVFINIIDNSIKFTEANGTIVVDLVEKSEEVSVRIVDTGVGISVEEIDLVTGKFYKGTNSNSHTGLGLSICEEIIKLHKGRMIIESEVNKGTSIEFVLPKGDRDVSEI